MRTITFAVLASVMATCAVSPCFAQASDAKAPAHKAQPPKGFETLSWLAGTRYIERDGVKSYETWTGPSGGYISGSVASASGGGLVEFFMVGPNAAGVYGLSSARTTTGLTTWSFRPVRSLEAGRIVFADDTGGFSIEKTPDGGIHNIATRITSGKEEKSGEWYWLPVR
jgi:hypothetical protein